MSSFLVLTLYAPLASWGDVTVGELRSSWDRPSRSAVLGLVAAALGIERSDQNAHDALDSGYGCAVRLHRVGGPLTDYHTVQTAAQTSLRRKQIHSRRDVFMAAGLKNLETLISRRSYRTDQLSTVALWSRPDARWPLMALVEALRRPGFVPYAGRKSNPLGLPLNPHVIEAETLAQAFIDYDAKPSLVAWACGHLQAASRRIEVSHDDCAMDGIQSGLVPLRKAFARDAGADRGRWQFKVRTVQVSVADDTPGGQT